MIPRFVAWLRRTFQDPGRQMVQPEPSPPPRPSTPLRPVALGPVRETRRLKPMAVPAEGDVFNFHVFPWVTWYGDGMTQDQLIEIVARQEEEIRTLLLQEITDVSRRQPPHHALELEQLLNARFGRPQSLGYGVMLRWEARVQVLPEARVQDKLRPYLEQRMEMDSKQYIELHRVQLVDELTRSWSEVLQRLRAQPYTLQAAKLAEQEFAKILEELGKEENAALDKLRALLKEASSGHNDLGLYEYAEVFDKLVKQLEQRAGTYGAPPVRRQGPAAGNGRPG